LKLTVEKLIVRVDIANVRVSPLNKGDYQIDQLELAVAVDNLRQNDALSNCLVNGGNRTSNRSVQIVQ
jgi:hypothetical protein